MTVMVATNALVPALICGTVIHRRSWPAAHRLRYPSCCLRLPLSGLPRLAALGLPLNRFGWMTFDERDHGGHDGSPLASWIGRILADHKIAADGEVELVCFPRMLGYAFKPVSFWICRDAAGAVRAVLAEVHNTFGETHNYLLHNDDRSPLRNGQPVTAAKAFHVSPYLGVEGRYTFRFHFGPAHFLARIDYADASGATVLTTSLSGTCAPLTRAALRRARFRFPLQALGVVVRIHWNALLLWCKSVPFHAKPHPPMKETSR